MQIENLAHKVLKRCKVIREKKDDIIPKVIDLSLSHKNNA